MKRNPILDKIRKSISVETKREIDLSFEIADRIHEILEKQGKSQRDLAQALGKKESEISKWLTGRHNFTTQTIAKIEIALDERIISVNEYQQDSKEDYKYVILSDQLILPLPLARCNNDFPFKSEWMNTSHSKAHTTIIN